jgi:methionyl-tRNA formyltransferase
MRIVVHGQQAFGKAVLERLLEQQENVVAVCVAPDKEGRPVDPLKELAQAHGLPVHQPASWKTEESLQLMRSFEAHVCMMAYVLLFVPEAVLDAPRLGSFQYHPSLLPMHRGPSSINWPIAMGETRTGLSIFWPNDGLDEGPILMQKTCDIGPDETLGDVYFKKLFPMGVDAMLESLELVKEGKAPRTEQNLDEGSYESWFGKAQARIDWTRNAQDVYNIIRAGNPQPGAWTIRDGREIRIYDSRLSRKSGSPGTVVAIDGESFTVAAGDGSVRIMRVRAEADKASAAEYVASSNLSVGDAFG